MDELCGHCLGICLGSLCALLCIGCCESAMENSRRERIERDRQRHQRVLRAQPRAGRARLQRQPNQDDDIWNISSRVNQQGSGTNWPTHDHHLNVDDFVLAPEYTAKDTRPPPPPYAEVDLPSYEQATGCRAPQSDLPAVHAPDRNVAGPSR